MRVDRRSGALIAILLVLGACVLAVPAVADDKGWHGEKREKGRDHDKWDKDWYPGQGGYPYPAAYPVAYPVPVYVPANYGGDQGACYQACVNSGQYSPAQCGRMCYYA